MPVNDPKRPLREADALPPEDAARNVAGDMDAADPNAQDATSDAVLGNDLSSDSARGVTAEVAGAEAIEGESEREDAVDARDVAGDTRGASR